MTPAPANKKIRLEDVAKAAEVSISAASMALADHPRISAKTKQKVRRISRSLGYRSPSEQSPTRRRTRQNAANLRLGFLLIGDRLQDDINVSMLHGLTTEANAKGVRIELGAIEVAPSNDPVTVTDHMLRFAHELDGLLISGLVNEHLLAQLREIAAAHVVIGQVVSHAHRFGVVPDVHVIAPDDIGMGYAAGTYLLSRGHTRLAFIAETLPTNMCHDRWLAGLRLAHASRGVAIDNSLVITSGRDVGQIERIITTLKNAPHPPDALVMPEARLAASLLPALNQFNRSIPRDAVVVSGSEELIRQQNLHTSPALLTAPQALAQAAIDRLLHIIHAPHTPPATLLVPHPSITTP